MSQPTGNCPSCGAPVQFRWSSAVQTVCPFCRSILVRTDVDIQKVGQVADLPPDPSPIQLLTEGVYRGTNFQVIGRILYEYENGGWNEWHIVFGDGSSGWLSDAQLQYAISFRVDPRTPLPDVKEVFRGKKYNFEQTEFRGRDADGGDVQGLRRRAAVPLLWEVRHAVRGSADAGARRSGHSTTVSSLRCCSWASGSNSTS